MRKLSRAALVLAALWLVFGVAVVAHGEEHLTDCILLFARETPRDVPDETVVVEVPAEVEAAVFEGFVGSAWRDCKRRDLVRIKGTDGHVFRIILIPRKAETSLAERFWRWLVPLAHGADDSLYPETTPAPTTAPTPTPSPAPTPAPPLCGPDGFPADPTKPCTQVVHPLQSLSQRVTQLEAQLRSVPQFVEQRIQAALAAQKGTKK